MSTQQALGRWIRVTPSNYVVLGDAIEVGILISPYDIPDGVRGGYDKDLNRFVVEFRYMVDEEYRSLDVDDGVCIRLGKHSGRIVGVEVDVDRLNISEVIVAVKDRSAAASAAIGKAMRNVDKMEDPRARRRENYIVAQRVLEDKHDAIFDNMPHAVAS